jgi:serine/threonine-protein kinase
VSPKTVSEIKKKWIWPFELLEKLGEGGMGVVYRARYVKNDRQVAVKLLPDDVSDEIVLGRFDRELEILRKLRHPNIVHCFGGTTEGAHRFYAMEIVEGGGFDLLLERRGQLPWEVAVKYFQQMTAALQYAHSHGVTHRDIKPGNFLIASNGQLKLSDFGLATFSAARNLTAAGKTMGTFRYMSPEQIRGKDISPRSDLYSLGCVMYETLAGHPPFDGTSPAEILDQHLHKSAPRVGVSALDCPADLDELISELLQKEIDQRPESATEVAARLEEISPVKMVSAVIPPKAADEIPVTASLEIPKRQTHGGFWAIHPGLVLSLLILMFLLLGWSLRLSRQAEASAVAYHTLVQAWNQQNMEVKRQAAVGLGRLGRYKPQAIRLLGESLTDESPKVRELALVGLAEAKGNAENYSQEVYRLYQKDPEPEVRYQAKRTRELIESGDVNASGISLIVFLFLTCGVLVGAYFWARRKYVF